MTESAWFHFFLYPRDAGRSLLKLVVKAALLSVALACFGTISTAQQPQDEITTKSIEDLMNIEVSLSYSQGVNR